MWRRIARGVHPISDQRPSDSDRRGGILKEVSIRAIPAHFDSRGKIYSGLARETLGFPPR